MLKEKKIGVGSPSIFWLTCDGTTGILISLILSMISDNQKEREREGARNKNVIQ